MTISYLYGTLTLQWDAKKADYSWRKHRVSFHEAVRAFFDDAGRVIPDPEHSQEEERFILMGMSWKRRILVVCHCYREAARTIRIISARKATRRERAQYEGR